MSIFISYSRKDASFANRISSDLQRSGYTVWIDFDNIEAGRNWSDAIQEGLLESSIMLVIISPDSMLSQHVKDEWQFFLDNEKPIIPILWKPTNQMHFQLNRLNYIDFSGGNYEMRFESLQSEIENLYPKANTLEQPRKTSSTKNYDANFITLFRGTEIPSIQTQAENAKEISMLAVSGLAWIRGARSFLEDKLKSGVNLRIILLNPEASFGISNWKRFSKWEHVHSDIQISFEILRRFQEEYETLCQVKLLDFHFPFNFFGVNIGQSLGSIRVGYYGLGDKIDERPYILLTPQNSNQWFNFYQNQFEEAWKQASEDAWDNLQ